MRKRLLVGLMFALTMVMLLSAGNQAEASLKSRTVRMNDRGFRIAELQNRLNELGYDVGRVDGSFGPKTLGGVKNFQRDRHLLVDGIVGPQTWNSLYAEFNEEIFGRVQGGETRSRGGEALRYTRMIEMTATGYSPQEPALQRWGGVTFTGIPAKRGVVAVDPRVIPLGTRLYVEGYGHALAADTGSAIKGNRIDLCFDTLEEMRRYNHWQRVKVYVLD